MSLQSEQGYAFWRKVLSAGASGIPAPMNRLAPWQPADFPAAPPFNFRNFIHVIGPGKILLATPIESDGG